jgi:hypothetical protein
MGRVVRFVIELSRVSPGWQKITAKSRQFRESSLAFFPSSFSRCIAVLLYLFAVLDRIHPSDLKKMQYKICYRALQ